MEKERCSLYYQLNLDVNGCVFVLFSFNFLNFSIVKKYWLDNWYSRPFGGFSASALFNGLQVF